MILSRNTSCLMWLASVVCFTMYLLYPSPKRAVIRDIPRNLTKDIAKDIISYTSDNLTRHMEKDAREDCFKGKDYMSIPTRCQKGCSSEKRAKDLFFERISKKERKEFRKLIKTFSEGVPSNVSYFLYAGTLLGSFSHHGMIPWDDDIDIIARDDDRPVLLKFLQSLRPEYELYTGWTVNWKWYHQASKQAGGTPWKWPFLDIFFYSTNTNLTYIQDRRSKNKMFNKSDVFPLIKRPFMGMKLPAPRNTHKVLNMTYDVELCKSNSYDHRLEAVIPTKCRSELPCQLLKEQFPFVDRTHSGREEVKVPTV
ncbi:uncharacterized protein RT0683-like [Haliotis cracherodii]|uniref:uncharacterized protein RT0683-like n=1 Tax=Haliotis cracherodii TaxID=6455 RepID=UPI0039E73020